MYSSGVCITISVDDQTVCCDGYFWSLINFSFYDITQQNNTVRSATIYTVRIYSYLA